MYPSPEVQQRLKEIEGWSAKAYPDATGHSIGYGHFIDPINEAYLLSGEIDKTKGQQLFDRDLAKAVQFITTRIKVPINQNQLDALVLLTYNAGQYPITTGTLDDRINGNQGEAAIRSKWMEYNKSRNAAGVLSINRVLTARRIEEVNLYFTRPGDMTPIAKKKS